MAMYTVPVQQAESQLRQLIERTQHTQQPVVFTKDGTAESVAVLIESQVFEELQRHKQQLFHVQVKELQHQLNRLEEALPDRHLHQPLMTDFKNQVQALWKICPEAQKDLCVMLMMASRRLYSEFLSLEQIAALDYTLALLDNETTDEVTENRCYRQLLACGLPPMMTGSNELAQLYEDEL